MKLTRFIDRLSSGLEASGRFRMLSTYHSVVRSVLSCCSPKVPTLDMVYTKSFLRRYEEYLVLKGCKRNTIAFYMTGLRSIGKCAVVSGALPYVSGLFDDVFTGSDPTGKRAVSPDVIARLHCADLSAVSHLSECRDLFMLSFHLQGMSFVDLVYLRKADIQYDTVVYRRHKTGGLVTVPIESAVREIFDRYACRVSDSPYLLPVITFPGSDGYQQYQNALRNHNRRLKSLAAYLGISDNLTSYVARHSWATIAYHHGVDVGVVSQGMGHHTEEVTRIYLASFARTHLLEANRTVFAAILRPIEEGRVLPVVVVRRKGCPVGKVTNNLGVSRVEGGMVLPDEWQGNPELSVEDGGTSCACPEADVRLPGKDGHSLCKHREFSGNAQARNCS